MHIKINQFQANVCFLSPGTSKPRGFLMFPGYIEMEHWLEMSS